MKQTFTVSFRQDGDWFVAQCLEVNVTSQGKTEEEALANLKEALEMHFEPQRANNMVALKGSAGSLNQPKSWDEIIQIAREDHANARTSNG